MYFDYAILGLIIWGVADAFFGTDDEIEADSEQDPAIDPETDAEGDLLDETDNDDSEDDDGDDNNDDVIEEEEEEDTTDEELAFVPGTTTITVETDGETRTSEFTDTDFGVAPTVSGTEFRDTIEASANTGFAVNLDAGAGDDVVNFGFGANVSGGEGTDILTLSVTPNALVSGSDAGNIDLTDADDALSIAFDADTPEFVHSVRGQSVETIGGVETRVDWIDYYVSDTDALTQSDLTPDQTYPADDATRVFRAVIGTAPSGAPSDVNDDPTIVLNRTTATTVDLRT